MNNKFDYASERKEQVACDYCNSFDHKIINTKDRYGLDVISVICKQCGLIFINPRMTFEGYDRYYNLEGGFRDFVDALRHKGDSYATSEKGFLVAKKIGIFLAEKFRGYLNGGLTIEVGSSNGGMLAGIKEVIPELDVMGIEPALKEAEYAESRGIPTKVGLMENLTSLDFGQVDNIFIVRSLNHLLSPRLFFEWSRDVLREGGILVIMVINFINFCQKRGNITTQIQIDHPFMFSPDSLVNFAASFGFDIKLVDTKSKPNVILMIAENTKKETSFKPKLNPGIYKNTLKSLSFTNLAIRRLRKMFN